MGMVDKRRLPGMATSSEPGNANRFPIGTFGRKRSGIYQESTEAEQLGVLPHECTRVREAMNHGVSVVTPWTTIGEAVQLMKSMDVGVLIVCNGSTLVGTLSDREIALANAPSSQAIHTVITPDPTYCSENDLLIDAHAVIRTRGLPALPVRDSSGLLSGIVMRIAETTACFLVFAPLAIACWLSAAWSADVTPVPPAPLESRPGNPQEPTAPPPSRIDPGIERRPQTVPHPGSTVIPPIVDPKMAIDPETAPPATGKTKPGSSQAPPGNPSPR